MRQNEGKTDFSVFCQFWKVDQFIEQLRQVAALKLFMSYRQDIENKEELGKCSQCLTFYASEAFQGLCSSCYKMISQEKQQKTETEPSCPSTPLSTADKELQEAFEELTLEPEKVEQKDRKRCFGCSKKVGLLGIQCRCSFVYCNAHRLPQNHCCTFDHREKGREKLRQEIVRVDKSKIEQI